MTDTHPHMPAIRPTTARWLSPGKVVVVIRGQEHVLPWEEAEELAEAVTQSLRPGAMSGGSLLIGAVRIDGRGSSPGAACQGSSVTR